MAGIYGGNIRGQHQLSPSLNNEFLKGFLLFSLVLVNFQTVSAQGSSIRPFYPLYFTAQPQNAIVASGRSVTLNCTVWSASQPIRIKWFKGENEIDISNSNFVVLSTGAIRINSVTRTEQGAYHCTAEDSKGKMVVSQDAVLAIASLSSSIPSPEDATVHEGDTARFECLATGKPRPRITWQKDGTLLDLAMERIATRFALMPSGALEIHNIRQIDGGSYRCQATNDRSGQTVQSRPATLTIISGIPDPNREFEFIVSPEEVEARVGRNIVLEAATTEPAIYTWFKDDEEIVLFGGQDHYSIVGQGSLRIADLGEIDTGLYRVRASSSADGSTVVKTVRVTAQVPPSFLVKPDNAHANVGNPFTFKCSVYGIPPPEVRWLKDGDELDTSGDNIFKLVNGQNLQISQLIKEDDGTYQCVASNMVEDVKETIQAAAELIVLDEGVPIPTRPPSTTITTDITTVKPITTLPPGPATGPVPSKPRQLQAPRIGARSVTVKWREPTTTNGEIETYRIHIQAEGAKRQRIINVPADRLQWNVDDLVPLTTYRIYAYAVNENGQGEKSDTLTVETQGVVQVPDAPQNLVAFTDSATSIFVSWEPPSSTFGDIQNYRLYYADLGTGQATREEEIYATQNSYTVQGLNPYTRYGFRVVAINENGPGPSSEIVEARTFTDKPTSPPSNVTAQPYSASSILLKWNLPPTNQRNGDITGYKVRYRTLVNGKRAKTIVIDGVLRDLLISDLERDSEYEVRIGAVNINGTGPFTDWIPTRTLRDDLNEDNQPPPPAFLDITSYPTQILVRWQPPRDTSIMVRGYILGYGKGFPDRQILELSSAARSHIITNLEPNAQYVIKLRAFNLRGEGFSLYETVYTRQDTTVDPIVPRIIPPANTGTTSAPEVLAIPHYLRAIIKSPTSALMSWIDQEEGKDDGRYYQIQYKTGKSDYKIVNSTDLTYALNGLQPYTMYEFAIRVVRGSAMSPFSMATSNKTFQAAPSSAPKELTVYRVENSTTSLQLNWQPPKHANGIITGYTIYYSTDATLPIDDWIEVNLEGEDLTTTLTALTTDTMYHFRIGAHNVKGNSPLSDIISDQTPEGPILLVTAAPPAILSGAAAFPWWLWLVIVATIFLLLLLAILIVLCLVCGCCACCASCFPDSDCCGPCAPCCGALAACWTSCCPCCCADEEECGRCIAGLCCGATCCVCCGQQYKEKRKITPKVNANGKPGSELEGPDLWSNLSLRKPGQSSDMTKSPISDATELDPLNHGGGVDQQRGGTQETEFVNVSTTKRQNQVLTPNGSPLYATVANRSGSSDLTNHTGEEYRKTTKVGLQQDTYETPTISHRSSYESGIGLPSLPSMAGLTWSDGALHYASIYDKRDTRRMNGNAYFDDRKDTEKHTRSALDVWAEEEAPPVRPRTTSVKINSRSRHLSEGDGAFDVISPTSTSASFTYTSAENRHGNSKHANSSSRHHSTRQHSTSEAINDSIPAGYDAQDEHTATSRYNTWGHRGLDSQRNDYHSSTYHRDDRELHDFRTRDYSSLHSDRFVPIRTGPEIQTLDRRNLTANYDENSNQVVTFPDSGHYGHDHAVGSETKPFTITFEETKTSHQVERSVPMLDGTNYKTVSNHETFAKSYTTSDAAKDRNLQMMLQNGLENGPLAIEIPSTSNTALPALTAPVSTLTRPRLTHGSLTTDSRTTSSSPSSGSYHMGPSSMRTENTASHSLGATSLNYGQSNTATDATLQRLGRSTSLDFGTDTTGLLPPLAETKRIRPPLLPHRPHYPPDYDTVTRAKKKAASAYNLATTERGDDDFFYGGGEGSAFGRFRSSEFLFGGQGGGNSDAIGRNSATTQTTSQTKYNTMDATTRGGTSGFDYDSYADRNNSFGFDTGGGNSNERAFSSSVYGTSIGNKEVNGGLANGGVSYGGLTNGSGTGSLLTNSSTPPSLATGGGSNIESYHSSSAARSYQSYGGHQQMGMAGAGAEYSFNNNNAAGSDDDIAQQFASLSDLDAATAAFPIMPNLGKNAAPPRPRLQRSKSVDANIGLFDEDKYGFPKIHKYQQETNTNPRGRPIRRRHGSESQRDLRMTGVYQPPPLQRSASVDVSRDMHMGGVPGYDYATSPRSLHLNQPPYMYSSTTATSGYHSDTNTASSHEDSASQMSSVSRPTNPLSSFTVPGPPPHYQARVKISAPTYSPLKRNQPGGVGTGGGTVPGPRGRGQPLPVVTPRAPDVTVRGAGDGTSPTSSARTFSAEDLNAEMINLEGLMKDLNAITASELQS